MSTSIHQNNNSELKFWTPVKYGDLAQTTTHQAIEKVDEYFNLGGRVATVVALPAPGSSNTQVRLQDNRSHFLLTVLKVISYATLIIPTLMFLAKVVLRLSHSFTIVNQHSGPQPNNLVNDPVVTTTPATGLLKNYKLGSNATKCSELMLKIHSNVPEPDDLGLYGLHERLTSLGNIEIRDEEDDRVKRVGNNIVNFYDELIEKGNQRSAWEDRFLKMTILIYDNIDKLQDEELQSARAILAGALINAFAHCSNRKSTEIERLYDLYVVPELLAQTVDADMPKETLLYEFMNARMKKRDEIINRRCPDQHNAASHRYFRKELDKAVFYLPSPPLSAEDENYANYAMQEQQAAIIKEFQQYYHNPQTVYNIFSGIMNPKKGDKFQYKPEMFNAWLVAKKGKDNLDMFEEDMITIKPEIFIEFLVEKGFLAAK